MIFTHNVLFGTRIYMIFIQLVNYRTFNLISRDFNFYVLCKDLPDFRQVLNSVLSICYRFISRIVLTS